MPADDAATQAALAALMVRISAAGAVAVKKVALAVQAAGMAGTPVLSGTLRRSWTTKMVPAGGVGVYAAMVGPTMAYARRIELGFKGADSLGRVYDQAPKPYVKPAFDKTVPSFRPIVISEITRALRG
jgi:hypothetical protein